MKKVFSTNNTEIIRNQKKTETQLFIPWNSVSKIDHRPKSNISNIKCLDEMWANLWDPKSLRPWMGESSWLGFKMYKL